MKQLSVDFPIKQIAKLLDLSRSGYYRRTGQGPRALSNSQLLENIRRVFYHHKRRYGSPRIYLQLKREGITCSENRVARLMQKDGLIALCTQRKIPRTTDSKHGGLIAQNLLKTLEITRPNRAWAMDITYVRSGNSWTYLAAVLDLYLHKIVGWEVSEHIDSSLVKSALKRAVVQQGYPEGVLTHSDRGSQYASSDFIALIEHLGYERSMSAKGNCYDNAAMESFFGVLKREELDRWDMPDLATVRQRVFGYIETYYNRERIHTTIGMTPEEYEQQNRAEDEFSKAWVAPLVVSEKAGAKEPQPRLYCPQLRKLEN